MDQIIRATIYEIIKIWFQRLSGVTRISKCQFFQFELIYFTLHEKVRRDRTQ